MKIFRSVFVALGLSLISGAVPFAFWKPQDPCVGNPGIGTSCFGGAIYAGLFDGGKYMITPGGCADNATPTCSGSDSVTKTWRGSGGTNVDIPGLTNITSDGTPSSSSERGHVATPIITAHASTTNNSAANFCEDLSYGGHTDWYLPSKTELGYIYCKSNAGAGHNPSYPDDAPNCATYGGRQSLLVGFANADYWSSSEASANQARMQFFSDGGQYAAAKNTAALVRCIRRY